ncbi:regulator of chromosome condensation isoform X2 [Cricetulus griseus]|uniref:Regulator of chromosome condensation n=2 Tax=Cricetulus griseus TaxID=10029 RepID=G3H1Y8_CRIGR|nr:regulator of chromosome condensation isoform X2 [Cricetulus griseus]XP_035295447.1 regulator of chromosome condensation isoform X2 [Cricetulus griseus]EGW01158.1 Regulator of chromosome condensation [Cricetulus griseus]
MQFGKVVCIRSSTQNFVKLGKHLFIAVLSLERKMPPKRIAKRRSPPEDAIPKSKKVKVSHRSHKTEPGLVLTLGQGDVGQLGLGESVLERKKPALVTVLQDVVQAEAGGMHTVCLSQSGQVYSFGCNDEGALGRDTSAEGSEMVPGKVELQEKVVQVSAGDSHTAALTEDGRVFLWGSFRDNNGVIGLLEPMKKSMVPVQVQLDMPVVKVASGNDHLVMLTTEGDLYTLGCGDQGQLGRVPELFANRGGRQGLERLLVPRCVLLKARGCRGRVRFQDAFCGAYFTFAISREGHVYGFGLSNYHQLGTPGTASCFIPQNLTSFKNSTKSWVGFSGGQHHTICMDSEGKAYSLGRAEYGRLGLGEGAEEKSIPTLISRLPIVSSVACGASVGYAVSKDGRVFAWGMGTNYQLGTGQEEDAWSPVEMTGKQLENRVVLTVSSGGQHTVLLVKDKEQS